MMRNYFGELALSMSLDGLQGFTSSHVSAVLMGGTAAPMSSTFAFDEPNIHLRTEA